MASVNLREKKLDLKRKKAGAGGHGGGVRGADLSRRSSQFEGRFGRMFRSLPPAEWPEAALRQLGAEVGKDKHAKFGMISEPEKVIVNGIKLPNAPEEKKKDIIQDDEENIGIPAGYTYLGQFIDHDITFDPASSLQKQNDVDGLVDYRTPRLDLDSLYGRGPEDQPYMYFNDEKSVADKFRLGRGLKFNSLDSHSKDLPRFNDTINIGAARALIGDKRNDENVIVSQLHGVMLQFHNRLTDEMPKASFEEVQRQVRWHYQWIVVNDFLVKICGQEMVHTILPHLAKKNGSIFDDKPKLNFYKPQQQAYMPIEFAAAAYRFGHSMVRPIYRLNTELKGFKDIKSPTPIETEEEKRGIAGRFFIFAGVQERGLNGFNAFLTEWAIDWSLFFDIGGSGEKAGKERVQPSYKIDPSLVNPLGFLPEFSQPASPKPASGTLTIDDLQAKEDVKLAPSNLAVRNLLRGMSMALPSGQDVARAMGVEPVDDKNLRICKAIVKDWNAAAKGGTMETFAGGAFKGKAPLWYYVLAEAMYEWSKVATKKGDKGNKDPVHLGPVGGRIVAETLIGLLLSDSHSYLRQAPHWHPKSAGFLKAPYDMGALIKFALKL